MSIETVTISIGWLDKITETDSLFEILRHDVCKEGRLVFYLPVVRFLKTDELDVRAYAHEGIEEEEGYLNCLRRVYIYLSRVRELLRSLHEKVTWGKRVRQFERLPSFLTTGSYTDRRD